MKSLTTKRTKDTKKKFRILVSPNLMKKLRDLHVLRGELKFQI